MKKDYSVSCSRFVAMCFIVLCHIMQYDSFSTSIYGGEEIEWAFWFNVGVQMFLFLSGYLYGKKEKFNTISFYKKSFPKLLVDYYVFLILVLIIIKIIPIWSISVDEIKNLFLMSNVSQGLGHLWFVRTILFCYLFTPILFEIINYFNKHSDFKFYIYSLNFLILVHILLIKHFPYFSPAWINCYILGMLYSKIENKSQIKIFEISTIVLSLSMVLMQFRVDYFNGSLPNIIMNKYQFFCEYVHVLLGISLIFIIRYIFNYFFKGKEFVILNWSDKYSYDVYLTHHIFIQSPIACVNFISRRFIAIPLAIFLSVITAVVLYNLSKYVKFYSKNIFHY